MKKQNGTSLTDTPLYELDSTGNSSSEIAIADTPCYEMRPCGETFSAALLSSEFKNVCDDMANHIAAHALYTIDRLNPDDFEKIGSIGSKTSVLLPNGIKIEREMTFHLNS